MTTQYRVRKGLMNISVLQRLVDTMERSYRQDVPFDEAPRVFVQAVVPSSVDIKFDLKV